jgi:hypothetical protein
MSGFRVSSIAAATLAFAAAATGARAANLVVNGDFEAGNSGFSSGYHYSPGDLSPAGFYDVITSPSLDHPLFGQFGDHTSGAGLMMVVNGAAVAGVDVWEEPGIAVTPHKTYDVTAWVASAYYNDPAQLNVSINGQQVGSTLYATATEGQWVQFSGTWNSGSATTADLALVNQNISPDGNDFALDDISLSLAGSVPEPSAWALLLMGLGVLGGSLRGRRFAR